MTKKLYYNESIQEHLKSIAKLDDMVGPVEMIEGWYCDLYFPCHDNKELFEKGVWEKGQSEWRECFTQAELKILSKFHVVFDEVVDLLSTDPITFSNDANWKKVQKAADEALSEINVSNT